MDDQTAPAAIVLRSCPHCETRYRVVKVEADSTAPLREITCLACGGPLQGREGRFALKYFLVESRKAARAGRRTKAG